MLSTIEELNQYLFDEMCKHLRTMDKPCSNEEGRCYYRGDYTYLEELKGQKCAVGALISDTHYRERMENLSASDLTIREAVLRTAVDKKVISFELKKEIMGSVDAERNLAGILSRMQMVHDCKEHWETNDALEREIEQTATACKLQYKE